ncbi:MAG: hypothetical protein CMB17_04655 [Euryarchaeota archaeon]|nr:hypothetical protein [Euryarchaeota archaeon]
MGRNDILRAIKEAEASAEQTILAAKEKASRILSDARSAASESVVAGRRETEASAQSNLQSAREAASGEAAKVKKSGESTLSDVHLSAESNRDTAISLVLDAIRN